MFPTEAEVLLDELAVCGHPESAMPGIERWHRAGVDEVLLLLPPGAPEDLLHFTLEQLKPS